MEEEREDGSIATTSEIQKGQGNDEGGSIGRWSKWGGQVFGESSSGALGVSAYAHTACCTHWLGDNVIRCNFMIAV